MNLPTQYEIERIQLIALSAINLFDETKETPDWAMRDMAMFYENYPELMQKVTQCLISDNKPESKEVDALVIVALCFRGLDLLLNTNETMLYDLAKGVAKSVDIEKEFRKEIRTHVFQEILLRSA